MFPFLSAVHYGISWDWVLNTAASIVLSVERVAEKSLQLLRVHGSAPRLRMRLDWAVVTRRARF